MTSNNDIYNAIAVVLKHLVSIEKKLDYLTTKETKMAGVLDNLTTEVARQTTVDASVVTLLNGIVAQLTALSQQPTVDPAALSAIVAEIKANDDIIASAVTANTPAAAAKV